MNCKCIEKIDKLLKEKTEDQNACLNIAIDFNSGSGIPYIGYTYREKKKDGNFKENKKTGMMIPSHCPFCGLKI